MLWMVLVTGWLVVSPLLALMVGRAVALADRATPPHRLDEAIEDEPCPAEAEAQADEESGAEVGAVVEFEPELAAAG